MEKWRRYETLMIFDPELGTEATEDHVNRARDFITQESGRILKSERWGLRDMAFELKGRSRGYYLLLEYAGPAQAARELDRRLNLMDTVIKFQTIKLAEDVDPASLPDQEEEVGPSEEAAAETAAAESPSSRKTEDEDESEEDEEEDEDDEDQS